jgi:ketoreductase
MADKAHSPATINESGAALKGRVAIVTGASRGLGKAIAKELARQGATLGVCARSAEQLSVTQSEIKQLGSQCLAATCDVRNEAEIASFVAYIKSHFGSVDILVNNAGVYKTEPVASHTLGLWQEVIETNLTGAMLFCRAVLETMTEKKWGRIINISSVSGRTGEIWGSAYSASKFGLIGLTQSLALEVAAGGITVNAVCPGWVFTDMTKEQLQDPEWCKLNGVSPEQALANASFGVPQNRFIEPEEVAALVAYLGSDAARGITGQSINICGGLSLQ